MFPLPVPLRCTRLAEQLSRWDRKRCKHWFVEAILILNHWFFLNSCLVTARSRVQECNVFSHVCLSFCLSMGRGYSCDNTWTCSNFSLGTPQPWSPFPSDTRTSPGPDLPSFVQTCSLCNPHIFQLVFEFLLYSFAQNQ